MKEKARVYVYVISIFIFLLIVSPASGEETIVDIYNSKTYTTYPTKTYPDEISCLNNIYFNRTEEEDIFTIDITGEFDFTYSYLQNPYRFFIDLYPTKTNIDKTEIVIDLDGIKRIRIARQTENKVRIVFDLEGPLRYKEIKKGETGLTITFPPRIKEISLKEEGDKIAVTISSTHTSRLAPETFYLVNPERIVIDIPDMTLMYENYIDVNNSPLKIKVSQYSIYPPSVRVVIEDIYKMGWNLEESGEPGTIRCYINRPKTSSVSKPTIILDPGHGGSDPGAIGPSGLKEKDVTLDIAIYTKGLLESYGYTVILTREGDYNVSQEAKNTRDELNARVIFVNNNKSAVLVSIHCNSAFSPIPGGIEVYYYRDEDKTLAESVCNSLVETTGRYNRGIKRAEFFLLKNSTIPAILVEALFISNPIEEKLLMDPLFRRKIASGIANGILRYLEKR